MGEKERENRYISSNLSLPPSHYLMFLFTVISLYFPFKFWFIVVLDLHFIGFKISVLIYFLCFGNVNVRLTRKAL